MIEQKLDRHTDPSGLVESMRHAGSGRPYLGSLEDVSRIVREFAGQVIERFDEVGHGVLTPHEAADADRQACLQLGKAFAGQDPAYAEVKEWSGKGLADHLRVSHGHKVQPDDDDAALIAQVFGVYVHGIYDLLREAGNGAAADAMQQTLERDTHNLVMELLGVSHA